MSKPATIRDLPRELWPLMLEPIREHTLFWVTDVVIPIENVPRNGIGQQRLARQDILNGKVLMPFASKLAAVHCALEQNVSALLDYRQFTTEDGSGLRGRFPTVRTDADTILEQEWVESLPLEDAMDLLCVVQQMSMDMHDNDDDSNNFQDLYRIWAVVECKASEVPKNSFITAFGFNPRACRISGREVIFQ
ncbi:Uncharacterized protein PBTT_02527 [Plasmodiophora brassicae]